MTHLAKKTDDHCFKPSPDRFEIFTDRKDSPAVLLRNLGLVPLSKRINKEEELCLYRIVRPAGYENLPIYHDSNDGRGALLDKVLNILMETEESLPA